MYNKPTLNIRAKSKGMLNAMGYPGLGSGTGRRKAHKGESGEIQIRSAVNSSVPVLVS